MNMAGDYSYIKEKSFSRDIMKPAKQELYPNKDAPAFKSKRKVVLYATCSGNWNKTSIGVGNHTTPSGFAAMMN